MDSGDTAWMLVSSALVMLMTPGLALFYGGLARSKNVLGTIMHSFIMLGVITLQFVIIGFSLAFGPDQGGVIGNLDWAFLNDVLPSEPSPYAATIPASAYMVFQLMFAVITPALITGAFAERAKFSTFIVFMVLWATLVYDPVAHWVWALGGWLGSFPEANGDVGIKAIDFAGGTVVHINAGVALGGGAGLRRAMASAASLRSPRHTMVVIGAACCGRLVGSPPAAPSAARHRHRGRWLHPDGHQRLRGNPCRNGYGGGRLDGAELVYRRQAERCGRRGGRCRGPGGDYAGVRLRQPHGIDCCRRRRRRLVLLRSSSALEDRAR
jgi:hypothetical protein